MTSAQTGPGNYGLVVWVANGLRLRSTTVGEPPTASTNGVEIRWALCRAAPLPARTSIAKSQRPAGRVDRRSLPHPFALLGTSPSTPLRRTEAVQGATPFAPTPSGAPKRQGAAGGPQQALFGGTRWGYSVSGWWSLGIGLHDPVLDLPGVIQHMPGRAADKVTR
jgi:hypothetical protein